MDEFIKNYIEKNINLIENEDWVKFFQPITADEFLSSKLPHIYSILRKAQIQPIQSKLDDEAIADVLISLGDITGMDNNFGKVPGKFAKSMKENEINSPVSIDAIGNIALQLGFKVYETPDGYYGYDPDDPDFIIINPVHTTLKKWFDWGIEESGLDGSEYEFDPSMYDELTYIRE